MKATLLFFFLSFIWCGYAQSNSQEARESQSILYDQDSTLSPLKLDRELLENYSKDSRFDYSDKEVEENWWSQFKTWIHKTWNQFWLWIFGDYESNSFLVFLFKVLPYLIIIGVLIFIIWLFYRLNPGVGFFKSKTQPEILYSNEEKIIRSKNIDKLVDDALTNQDYRLAIRYYYLKVIKGLDESEIIEYQFDKTNSDYISEINNKQLKSHFLKVTFLYEYIWYGNFAVSNSDFSKAQAQFVELDNLISKKDG